MKTPEQKETALARLAKEHKFAKRLLVGAATLSLIFACGGCNEISNIVSAGGPSPTATATETHTPTATSTITPTPSFTPTATPRPSETPTPLPSPRPPNAPTPDLGAIAADAARSAVQTALATIGRPDQNPPVTVTAGSPNERGDINVNIYNQGQPQPAPTAETRIVERIVSPTPDPDYIRVQSKELSNLLTKAAEKGVEEARPKIEAEAEIRGEIRGAAKAKAEFEAAQRALPSPTPTPVYRVWGFPFDPPWGLIGAAALGAYAAGVATTKKWFIIK